MDTNMNTNMIDINTFITLQFNDNVTLKLSTSSFLFKGSNLFKILEIDETVPILCPSSYVLDENKTFYFDDKSDLSFMFTLDITIFINLCHFLDIIEYENTDYNEPFILYVMKHNIIHQLTNLHAFMRSEIKSMLNYTENKSADIQIRTCTPLFYNLYLTKYKEEVIKYGHIDIYELSTCKSEYYKFINKYNNQLTFIVKETQQYKNYIKNCNDMLLEASYLKQIQYLIECGAEINVQDKHGDSILHIASKYHNNIEVIKYLVENGADIHLENTMRNYIPGYSHYVCNTALNIASLMNNNYDVIKYLFDNSILKLPSLQVIDINNFNKNVMPLFNTIISNNVDIIKYLYESYISLYILNGYDKKTVLNEIWPSLCVNWTILHLVTRYTTDYNLIIYFIEQGVNVNSLTPLYNIPLDMMLKNNATNVNIDSIKYMVNHGLDIKNIYNNGETILHRIAYFTDNIEIIKYLIEQGINVNVKSKWNKMAFDIAIEKKHYNIVSYLCNYYNLPLFKILYYKTITLLPDRLTNLLNKR